MLSQRVFFNLRNGSQKVLKVVPAIFNKILKLILLHITFIINLGRYFYFSRILKEFEKVFPAFGHKATVIVIAVSLLGVKTFGRFLALMQKFFAAKHDTCPALGGKSPIVYSSFLWIDQNLVSQGDHDESLLKLWGVRATVGVKLQGHLAKPALDIFSIREIFHTQQAIQILLFKNLWKFEIQELTS